MIDAMFLLVLGGIAILLIGVYWSITDQLLVLRKQLSEHDHRIDRMNRYMLNIRYKRRET